MMLETVIFFLSVSLLFYALFGGADFGAGIIETFIGKKHEKVITKAIAPVWEANHIWFILVVVILFMGFPKIYSAVSTYLHIPILIMLLGIVLRGASFTFRHYDIHDARSEKIYTLIFRVSSFITPFFIGVIIGGMMLGRVQTTPVSFYENFIAPWFNLFSFALGIFTCSLFAFLAAVFLLGETKDETERQAFTKVARIANMVLVLAGGVVFVTAHLDGLPLLKYFTGSPLAITALVLATVSLPLLWWFLKAGKVLLSRLTAGFQTVLILGAWQLVQFPVVLHVTSGESLTLLNTVAPDATLKQLVIALVAGSLLIFPSLFFLMRTFKREQF